jgi:hypothetical protein
MKAERKFSIKFYLETRLKRDDCGRRPVYVRVVERCRTYVFSINVRLYEAEFEHFDFTRISEVLREEILHFKDMKAFLQSRRERRKTEHYINILEEIPFDVVRNYCESHEKD